MKRLIAGLPILATLAVTGCLTARSPDYRYYTLDMAPSGDASLARCNVTIDRMSASEPLARGALLVKVSPTRAEYYAEDLWLAPVEDLVREKLEAEFGPHRADRVTVALRGRVLAFEQVDRPGGADALVKMDVFAWVDRGSGDGSSKRRAIYEARTPAESPTPDAVSRALSRAVEEIAREIAADADRLAATSSGD